MLIVEEDESEAEDEGDQISCQESCKNLDGRSRSCRSGINDSRAALLALAHLREGLLHTGLANKIPNKLKWYLV